MSMLKKLKSYFIVEDEELIKQSKSSTPKEDPAPMVETPKAPPVVESSPIVASDPSSTASSGKVSTKFMEILLGAIERNNLDGFDYLEYKQALKNLAKMPMDEKTRYQSAFAAAQTMGATPDQLVKAANFYIEVLSKEQAKFQQALGNQRTKQIGDKEQQINKLSQVIQEKARQIEQLGKEIEQGQQQLENLKQEISSASVKVESTKNDFIASYNSLVAQIRKDIENMQKYLK